MSLLQSRDGGVGDQLHEVAGGVKGGCVAGPFDSMRLCSGDGSGKRSDQAGHAAGHLDGACKPRDLLPVVDAERASLAAVARSGCRDATNWPRCPRHPDSHPMKVSTRGATAVWTCPADEIVISSIGEL